MIESSSPSALLTDAGTVEPSSAHGVSWAEDEIAYLRKHYRDVPLPQIAMALGRSQDAIAGFARTLGLKRSRTSRRWTEEEDELLRSCYEGSDTTELANRLGRTRLAVYTRASELGLRHCAAWTGEEISRLKMLAASGYKQPYIAKQLGRAPETVKRKCSELHVTTSSQPWPADEIETLTFLVEDGYTAGEIARKMDRERYRIEAQCAQLGLEPRKRSRDGWSDEELDLLRALYPVTRNRLIATRLNKKQGTILCAARLLGLKKDPRFLEVASRQSQLVIGTAWPAAGGKAVAASDPPSPSMGF